MRQRTRGQSLVEMALILPLMLMVLFGIIDIGWYVYGYSSIFQATRNAAEVAAQLPPYPERLALKPDSSWMDDPCVRTILANANDKSGMFPGVENNVIISYPNGVNSRRTGDVIQIDITYNIQPLTPLFEFVMMGNNGVMTVKATTQRTIESLGENPNFDSGVACSKP